MGLLPRFAAWLAVFACAPCAHAVDVYYAGFAWLGDAERLDSNYPVSRALNQHAKGTVSPLDSLLASRMRELQIPDTTIRFDELGTLGPDSPSSIALAFVLDGEYVSVETIGNTRKILVGLSWQALFFDFREGAVVASFPGYSESRHTVEAEVPRELIQEMVRQMYFDDVPANVISDFGKLLTTRKLNDSVTRRIQVTQVSIEPEARKHLPKDIACDDEAFRGLVAQFFSAQLSSRHDIPVLPYSVGHAIGNRMAGRFADDRVFDLRIPQADYEIHLSLQQLKRVELARDASGTTLVYGPFLQVRVLEPLANNQFIDATFKYGASKVVPVSQPLVDDWAAFRETLLALMQKFGKASAAPDKDWERLQSETAGVKKQMNVLQKVLQSCR